MFSLVPVGDRGVGAGVAILSTLPVVLMAWFFGVRGGLLGALVAALGNVFLVATLSSEDFAEWFVRGGGLGSAALLGVGVVVGWLSDLRGTAATELARRRVAEEELTKGRDGLARRVDEQTAALQERERDAQRVALESAALAEIGRIIGSSLDIDEVYQRFTEQVGKIIPFDRTTIITLRRDTGVLISAYRSGVDIRSRPRGFENSLKGTQAEEVLRTRAVSLAQTEDRDELEARFPALLPMFDAGIRSFMAAPLTYNDDTIGFLQLQSMRTDAYSHDDVALAERVGDQIAGAVANAQIYAERQAADEELNRSNAQLVAVMDSVGEGVITVDSAGTIVMVNHEALAIWGYDREEILGKNASVLMPSKYRRDHADGVERYRESGGSREPGLRVEREGIRKDGTVFPLEYSVTETRIGGDLFFTGAVRDITERKQLEERIVHSQKLEAVGRLAGGVAHDFNNLLTAITGYSHLGLTRSNDDVLSGYLHEVQGAADRAAHLTSQLLAFSRRQMIEPKVVSLNDLVLDTGSLLRRLIGEDIELVILPSAALSNVKVDPSQIEQGLMNLAINARDAMPSGGRLVVETADIDLSESYAAKNADASSGEHVVVAVRDTGVGMTAEIRSRVFEPFFTTKEVGKGTGLGLSMCYGIVAQSGGHMTVESEPGEGATFRIFLPRATEDVEAPSAGDSSPPLPLGSETVLLVEDEPAIRRVEAHLLGDHGYRVLEAANGVDALRLVQESHDGEIHLLVADVVMPLMGGRELAQELIQIHPETKVLHTSGYAGDVTENHGTPISGADFLQKPFTPDVFVRKVREILDSRN